MKKHLLSAFFVPIFAAAQAAPTVSQSWSLYNGTTLVKTFDTPSLCAAAANALAPGTYLCVGATAVTTVLNPGTKTAISNAVTAALNPINVSEWQPLAKENGTFNLASPKTVRYGLNTTWILKNMPAGAGTCNNATFTDPLFGTGKVCEVHFGDPLLPVPVTPDPNPPPPPAAALVWSNIGSENSSFTVTAPTTVRYGAGSVWVEKSFTNSTQDCSNKVFGDPAVGVVKHCESSNIAPTQPVMPPVLDHSKMAVVIDPILRAAVKPAVGETTPRVRSTWHPQNDWNGSCLPNTDGCFVFDAEKPAPSDIGDFREPTKFAKFGNFDPIVNAVTNPNDPVKVSHDHTFMGNTCINALTTPESLVAPGCGSTNAGGSLNLSSYWFPTGVDSGNGQPLVPTDGLVYYKDSYEFDISKKVELMPVGLRAVSGNALNTDPNNGAGSFTCFGPNGEQGPTAKTIAGAIAGGTCKKGGTLHFGVAFPYCWDGINNDSPDHHSHLSSTESYVAITDANGQQVESKQGTPGSYYGKRCPASHPHVIPVISFSFAYALTDDGLASRIRFSNELEGTDPGAGFHIDYYMGWDVATGNRWVNNCLRKNMDCHAWLLGDGYTLY